MPSYGLLDGDSGVDRSHLDAARRLARAIVKTLGWIHAHSDKEVRARLPDKFRTEDVETDLMTLRYVMVGLSTDGHMPPGGREIVYKVLASSFDKLQAAKFDLSGNLYQPICGAAVNL
jgi:NitT/TauT family transport system substrate-binding protein